MMLADFGLEMTEAELCLLCDCTVFGTEALQAVDAVRRLGFVQTAKYTLSIEELAAQLNSGSYPIVFVNTLPIDGHKGQHACVVFTVDLAHVTVYDPLYGERILPCTTFTTAWAMINNLTILIQR